MGDDDWDEETALHRYSPNPAPAGELDHLSLEDRGILLDQLRRDADTIIQKTDLLLARNTEEADQRYVSCLHMLHAVTLCHHSLALCIVNNTCIVVNDTCNNTSHMYDVAGYGKSVAPFSVHLVCAGQAPNVGRSTQKRKSRARMTTLPRSGEDAAKEGWERSWRKR